MKANYSEKLLKVRNWLKCWEHRHLSLLGKIVVLRAILRKSEAKLEMTIFDPLSTFVWRQFTLGISKNSHIWICRCIVAMVTALEHVRVSVLDDVGLGDYVLTESTTQK